MIVFNAPAAIAPVVAYASIAAAAASAAAAGLSAYSSYQQGEAAAADAKLQARLAQTEAQRAVRDEREENKRQLARTRALLSGSGGDLSTILSLTSAQGRESLIRQHRIKTGAAVTRETSQTRAANLRQQGRTELAGGALGAGGSLLTGYARVKSGQI